jgi:hypothetical protein
VAHGKIRWLWAIAPLGAAALWLFAPALERAHRMAPPNHPLPQASDFHVFLPIKETSTLVGVEDLTVIDTAPAHPVRLVRARWIDDVTYAGDDGQSTIHRQQARAEIIPITLEAY